MSTTNELVKLSRLSYALPKTRALHGAANYARLTEPATVHSVQRYLGNSYMQLSPEEQPLFRQSISQGKVPDINGKFALDGACLSYAGKEDKQATIRPNFNQIGINIDHSVSSKEVAPFFLSSAEVNALPGRLHSVARNVWVHNDGFAHRATHALDLEAFTIRNHIFFSCGRWQPKTASGLALLQHELGHVSRGEGRSGAIEGWSPSGHKTITEQALKGDTRYSQFAKLLLVKTAAIPDYNHPQVLQDMVSFWSGENLLRAPLGFLAGALIGSITPPEQGSQVGSVRISGALPQAILGTGLIPTIPASEQVRRGKKRTEFRSTRVRQELANHGEDLPERNRARMNFYVDNGIRTANLGDMRDGLVQLGYALHTAQDRGSHGDGYTANYVQNKPHSNIDNMALNREGVAVAMDNSKEALDRFFNGIDKDKKRALANSLALKLEDTRPPIVETILAPPKTTIPKDGKPESRTGIGFPLFGLTW